MLGLFASEAATLENNIDPEIVRLSYVQGDVRFSRGDRNGPDLAKSWEQATENLPILKGYSVATGEGRAEVEFESGSTLYLAENSVLLFQTLTVSKGVPSTELELVTGTATCSIHSIPTEAFDLATPTEHVAFIGASLTRVDSYLDGALVTSDSDGWVDVKQTFMGAVIRHERVLPWALGGLDTSGTPDDWDDWVAARVEQRQATLAAALQASGQTSFTPGLTDLYNGGKFFPCPPFGVCWEPRELSEVAQESGAARSSMPTSNAHAAPQTQQQGTTPPTANPAPKLSDYYYPLGTCPVSQLHIVTVTDPVTGKKKVVRRTTDT
jgi:hypothetical protein